MTSSGINNLLQMRLDKFISENGRKPTTDEIVKIILKVYEEYPPRSAEEDIYDLQRGFCATKSAHIHF